MTMRKSHPSQKPTRKLAASASNIVMDQVSQRACELGFAMSGKSLVVIENTKSPHVRYPGGLWIPDSSPWIPDSTPWIGLSPRILDSSPWILDFKANKRSDSTLPHIGRIKEN